MVGIGLLFFFKWKREAFSRFGIKLAVSIVLSTLAIYEVFLFKLYSGFVFLANYGGIGVAYLCRPEFIPQYLGFASKAENSRINEWVIVENPLGRIAMSNLTNPSIAGSDTEMYRIGIRGCIENPVESILLVALRLISVWRPSVVFGAYSLEIFLVSLVFWVPLTILMIKFLIGKDYSPALRQLRLYFLVMGGTFTVSLLLTFPQVRHRVAFAEVFYWLFAVIVLDRYLSRKKTKSPS